MNRATRMLMLVQQLWDSPSRPRTVPSLAMRLSVSDRTVQRDLQTLTAAGFPIRNIAGRGGGWFVDPEFMTRAAIDAMPVSLTGQQALTITLALIACQDPAAPSAAAGDAMQAVLSAMRQHAGECPTTKGRASHGYTQAMGQAEASGAARRTRMDRASLGAAKPMEQRAVS